MLLTWGNCSAQSKVPEFSVGGIETGTSPTVLLERLGPQLPQSDCHRYKDLHFHHYRGGMRIYFSGKHKLHLDAIIGPSLEIDGRKIVKLGDPVDAVTRTLKALNGPDHTFYFCPSFGLGGGQYSKDSSLASTGTTAVLLVKKSGTQEERDLQLEFTSQGGRITQILLAPKLGLGSSNFVCTPSSWFL